MTPQKLKKLCKSEKNIIIAELCGWERGPKENVYFIPKMTCWHKKSEIANWGENPPHFCSDLNDMFDAEETLNDEQYFHYCSMLWSICAKANSENIKIVHATSEQRADAFILTMDKT